jgi:hypothetical protein
VGGVEEDETSNSETEELPVARTRAGRAVKRPREYSNTFDSKLENSNQFVIPMFGNCS